MSAGIGELFIQLAFKGDVKGAQAFKKEIDSVTSSMQKAVKGSGNLSMGILGLVGTLTGAIYALNRMTDSLINNNQAWVNLTRQTDLALDSLQGYAGVASVLDKTFGMEGAAQGIAGLQQRLYELQQFGQGAQGFMLAGINPRGKDAFQVLEDLRQRIKRLNNTQATFLLKQLGLDPRMITMLRMSREEFEALNKEIQRYTLKDDQRQAIQEYSQKFELARKKMQYFKDTIVLALMPVLAKLTTALVKVAEAFHTILMSDHPLAMLAKTIAGVTSAVIALGVAIWAITAHPIVALITLIIGALMVFATWLALVIDDIIGWSQGKESVFGYLLGAIDKIVEDPRVPKWIKMLWDIISHADKLKELSNKFENAKEEMSNNPAIKASNFLSKLNPATAPFTMMGDFNKNFMMTPIGAMLRPQAVTNIINQSNEIITSETAEATISGIEAGLALFGAGK